MSENVPVTVRNGLHNQPPTPVVLLHPPLCLLALFEQYFCKPGRAQVLLTSLCALPKAAGTEGCSTLLQESVILFPDIIFHNADDMNSCDRYFLPCRAAWPRLRRVEKQETLDFRETIVIKAPCYSAFLFPIPPPPPLLLPYLPFSLLLRPGPPS